MSSSRANRRGILAIVAATATFTANDTIVKIIARTCPLGEVVFVRGLMTCVLVGGVMASLGHVSALRAGLSRVVMMRSGCEALAAILFTTALVHMPLAELSAVILISPLVITVLAVVLLGEIVYWRRWTAIAVGFAGVLFVVKPTPSAFDAWALLGVLCAFVSATRDLLTRRLDPRIPTIVVSLMAAVAATIAGAVLGLWESWRALQPAEIGLLAVAAVLLATGNFLVVIAFRGPEISVVAPFRYSILVWAGIAGVIVFGEIPDRWSLIGAALIVGSGVYALHREAVRGREVASRATPGT